MNNPADPEDVVNETPIVVICPQCRAVTTICPECKAVEDTPHLDGCARQHVEEWVRSTDAAPRAPQESSVTMFDLRRAYDG